MPTPAPQPSKGGNTILYVVLFFLGLVLVLYLISYFMKRASLNRGAGGDSKRGGASGGATQAVQAQTYNASSTASTPATNPNAVAQMFVENAQIKEVQALLNKEFPNTVAKAVGEPLVVDGKLGEKTLKVVGAIGTKGAEIANAIRTTRYVTGDQMKWLLTPPATTNSTAVVKPDGTLNNAKVVDDATESDLKRMNKTALETYIMRKNGWSMLVGLLWTESDLRNWAVALSKNRAEFEVRGSYLGENGIYSTRTGTIVRYF